MAETLVYGTLGTSTSTCHSDKKRLIFSGIETPIRVFARDRFGRFCKKRRV